MLITHQQAITWGYGQVETALCLWEAVLDLRTVGYNKVKNGDAPSDTYRKLEKFFDGLGSFTMRAVIASIVPECDRAWAARDALKPDDHIAFDFEFCPDFIIEALDNGLLEQASEWQHLPAQQIMLRKDWAYPPEANTFVPATAAA